MFSYETSVVDNLSLAEFKLQCFDSAVNYLKAHGTEKSSFEECVELSKKIEEFVLGNDETEENEEIEESPCESPCEKLGYKEGDKFIITKSFIYYKKGEVATLVTDNGTHTPIFNLNNNLFYMSLDNVKPFN